MKKLVSLLLAVLMVLGVVLVAVPANTVMAASSESESNTVTEYVLLLDSTSSNDANDESNQRIAAAQMFIDLIPADNASLSIFSIGPKDNSAFKEEYKAKQKDSFYAGKKHYRLKADKDRIYKDGFNTGTEARMQTIYQLVAGQTKLEMKDRTNLKELVAETFTSGAKYSGYSDEHCMIYAAFDYLWAKQAKNACIVFFGAQKAAAYKDFCVDGRNDESLYAAVSNFDDNYSNPDNSYLRLMEAYNSENDNGVPFKWSFNWIDITDEKDNNGKKIQKDPLTNQFYKQLCAEFSGQAFEVVGEGYGEIPQAVVSIMDHYLDKSESTDEKVNVTGKYVLPLVQAYSEVNLAITGTGFESISVAYSAKKDGAPGDAKTLNKTDTYNTDQTTIWFNKQKDIESKKFTYASVKMILPEPGYYTFTVNADNGGGIKLQTIKAKDAAIHIELGNVPTGSFKADFTNKDQKIPCNISFVYNQSIIANEEYLQDNIAQTVLHCKCLTDGQYTRDVPIESKFLTESGYTINFPSDVFTEKDFHSGTYEIYATVEAGNYFSGDRESEHYTLSFKNNAPVLAGDASKSIDGKRPGETVKLDTNQDLPYTDVDGTENDTIILTDLQPDNVASDYEGDAPVDNGDGTVTLPKHAGKYVYSATAVDNEGERSSQPITVTVNVTNEIPQLVAEKQQATKEKKGKTEIIPDEKKIFVGLPDLFLKIKSLKFNLEDKYINVPLTSYFSDADGDKMTFYIVADGFTDATGENNLLKVAGYDKAVDPDHKNTTDLSAELAKGRLVEVVGDALWIEPNMKGSDPITLTLFAEDITGNGELGDEDSTYVFEITVKSGWAELFSRFWWVLVVVGVLVLIVIILLATRRVPGSWNVSVVDKRTRKGEQKTFDSLATAHDRNLNKTKVDICDILCNVITPDDEEGKQSNVNIDEFPIGVFYLLGRQGGNKCWFVYKNNNSDIILKINGEEKNEGRHLVYAAQKIEIECFEPDSDKKKATLQVTLTWN